MYGGHNNYKISDVPWDKVTHINYAFATIKNNKIALFDEWAATGIDFGDGWDSPYKGNLGQIKNIKTISKCKSSYIYRRVESIGWIP
ncbi:hypothetical protein JTT00_05590 [Clostridium botulinum]|nr:hypothetical protein [Clostridium botulinum]